MEYSSFSIPLGLKGFGSNGAHEESEPPDESEEEAKEV